MYSLFIYNSVWFDIIAYARACIDPYRTLNSNVNIYINFVSNSV